MYHVVFEFTHEAGGRAYCRTTSSYKNEAEFVKLYKPNKMEVIRAEGVDEVDYQRLLNGVPIICLFLSAIEITFKNDQIVDPIIIGTNLGPVVHAAFNLLEQRRLTSHQYHVPPGLTDHLKRLSLGSHLKARYMKAYIDAYDPETDHIDMAIVRHNLQNFGLMF